MKILRPIPTSKIPSRSGGGPNESSSHFYDQLASRVGKLSPNTALPIECESMDECINLHHALHWRGYKTVTRHHTVYVKVEK